MEQLSQLLSMMEDSIGEIYNDMTISLTDNAFVVEEFIEAVESIKTEAYHIACDTFLYHYPLHMVNVVYNTIQTYGNKCRDLLLLRQ